MADDKPAAMSSTMTWVWVAVSIMLLMWLYGGRISDWMTATSTPAHIVDAVELMSEYEANEISADLKYKDEVIVVVGRVNSRGKDLLNHIYVSIDAGNLITSVQCFFAEAHAREVADIQIGQSLRIKGKADGKMGNVLLRNCQIVER